MKKEEMRYKISTYKEKKSGNCGPGSLKIILDSFGIKISEKRLSKLSNTTDEGVDEMGMLKAIKALGFYGFAQEKSSIKELRKYLKKRKFSVIVGWHSVDTAHYSVVADIDRTFIYISDPEKGKIIRFKIVNFINMWFTFSGDHPTPGTLTTREVIIIFNKTE